MFLTPGDDVPQGGPDDKLVHAADLRGAGGRRAVGPGSRRLALGIGLAAYAAVTEILQAVLPIDRDGDVPRPARRRDRDPARPFLSWVAVQVGRARGSA